MKLKLGFYTIMASQFFSSLADNALFVAAVELLRTSGAPKWQPAALVPMFALFYVVLAPFVGAFLALLLVLSAGIEPAFSEQGTEVQVTVPFEGTPDDETTRTDRR